MNYTQPADATVFTQDWREGNRLRAVSPSYQERNAHGTEYISAEWEALNPTPGVSGIHYAMHYGPLIFMHGRTTPGGKSLLAVVNWIDNGNQTGLHVSLIELDRWTPDKRWELTAMVASRADLLPGPDRVPGSQELRFYAGQPDPNDPTHWTIPYAVDGADGSIDMRLTADPQLQTYRFGTPEAKSIPIKTIVTRPDGTTWSNDATTPILPADIHFDFLGPPLNSQSLKGSATTTAPTTAAPAK